MIPPPKHIMTTPNSVPYLLMYRLMTMVLVTLFGCQKDAPHKTHPLEKTHSSQETTKTHTKTHTKTYIGPVVINGGGHSTRNFYCVDDKHYPSTKVRLGAFPVIASKQIESKLEALANNKGSFPVVAGTVKKGLLSRLKQASTPCPQENFMQARSDMNPLDTNESVATAPYIEVTQIVQDSAITIAETSETSLTATVRNDTSKAFNLTGHYHFSVGRGKPGGVEQDVQITVDSGSSVMIETAIEPSPGGQPKRFSSFYVTGEQPIGLGSPYYPSRRDLSGILPAKP